MPDDVQAHLARLIKDRVRLHLGPNALAQANTGSPVSLNGGEADHVATIALEVVAAVRGAELERVSGYPKRMEQMVIEKDREATQWAERLHEAEAKLARFRTFLDRDFRFWCSPNGVAAQYAKDLLEILDRDPS